MRHWLLGLLLFQTLNATEIGLEELLSNATQPKLIEERLEQQHLSLFAKSHAESSSKPIHLDSSIAYAESPEESGNEYEIGFSKAFKFGNTQELEQQAYQLAGEAYLLEESKQFIALHNHIKNLYHQHCLERDHLTQLQESVSHFEQLYNKKFKAYQYDEIAKTELLQLQMEQKRLQTKLDTYQQEVSSSQQQLLSLIPNSNNTTLSCTDLYPINAPTELVNTFSLTTQAYEKCLQSTQKGIQRQSKMLDTIEVSTGYTKELDRDLYSVGVSIPLNFTSDKQEQERVALMHQSSALELEHQQQQQSQQLQVQELTNKLNRLTQTITAYEQNIDHYQNELLPLMKKSYDYAQSSVMEYLLSQQQVILLYQELLGYKQSYYETLFRFYTLNELKDNLAIINGTKNSDKIEIDHIIKKSNSLYFK